MTEESKATAVFVDCPECGTTTRWQWCKCGHQFSEPGLGTREEYEAVAQSNDMSGVSRHNLSELLKGLSVEVGSKQ